MIVAVKPTKGSKRGQREWKLVDNEDSATVEDKKQRKQRLHREEMAQFRLRKKLAESKLRTQHVQLEREMERCLVNWKQESANTSNNKMQSCIGEQEEEVQVDVKLQIQLRNLVLQGEALRVENATLREAVAKHGKLQQVVYSEADRVLEGDGGDSVLGGGGWRVKFADGEASFHFHPFTKEQCAANVQRYDRVMIATEAFVEVGTLLGWRVERVPLVPHTNGKWMVTRVRFSKQIHCAAGASDATMDTLAAESWPVLTTPELSPRVHRANSTSLKLQELDEEDTAVVVSNTPQYSRGMHLRHLTMIHRRRSVDQRDRRTIT